MIDCLALFFTSLTCLILLFCVIAFCSSRDKSCVDYVSATLVTVIFCFYVYAIFAVLIQDTDLDTTKVFHTIYLSCKQC